VPRGAPGDTHASTLFESKASQRERATANLLAGTHLAVRACQVAGLPRPTALPVVVMVCLLHPGRRPGEAPVRVLMGMLEQARSPWSYDPDMRGLRALWGWRLSRADECHPLGHGDGAATNRPSSPPVLLQVQHGPRPPRCVSPAGQAWLGLAIHAPVNVLAIAVAIEVGVRTAARRLVHSS
jgi:hypothetical protein